VVLLTVHFLISFSKIFLKIIYKRLNDHININNILAKEQFGFGTNSSTEIATYLMINTILSSLSNKLLDGGLFCDLHKAFLSLNHEILLSKMRFCGISGVANKSITMHLQDRYQRVLINF